MKIVLLLPVFFAVTIAYSQPTIDSRNKDIVFTSVSVIPMDDEKVLLNQVVVIREGKIADIGNANSVHYAKNAFVIDGRGKYLIPGLAEMHAHVPPVNEFAPMEEVLMLFAVNGVTTIRGMLGHPRHLELRERIRKGEIIGPQFFTSGPSLNGNSVKSVQQAEEMVRSQKKAGYDFLKLHPGLTLENFDAIAATAKEVKIPFAGHVSYDVGVWHAIESGYATIDHLDGFVEGLIPGIRSIPEQETGLFGMFVGDRCDTSLIPKLMRALKQHEVWVVPTQSLAERWMTPERSAASFRNDAEMKYITKITLDQWSKAKDDLSSHDSYERAKLNRFIALRRRLIAACQQNGVGLLLGSDAPQVFNVPGFSLHHELKYMVDAGLTPYQALRTGTVNVARFYGHTGSLITKGARADLVLLNGNPLQDITNTQQIEGVMLGGLWLSKEFRQEQLRKLEKN